MGQPPLPQLRPTGSGLWPGLYVPDIFVQCIELVALQASAFEDVDHSSLDTAGKRNNPWLGDLPPQGRLNEQPRAVGG